MSGPLNGLVVIDASWGLPSAVGTMLLADYGAKVIKIERPGGGPDVDEVSRYAWDRNKLSIELDLDKQSDLAALKALLSTADVFVHSFRPGTAEKHGLGYAELHAEFPDLIYTAVSGYGQSGPMADRPGYDALVGARIGLMAEQPGHRAGPIFGGHQHIAYGTGFLLVIGTLSALRARRETGVGQQVDVSLFDSALAQASMNWWWNEAQLSYLARSEKMGFGRQRVLIDLYECADGEFLMIHTGGQGMFKRTMDLLGYGETIRAPRADENEAGIDLNDEEMQARDSAGAAFLTKPRDEWLRLFEAEDIAVLPAMRMGEVLLDKQVEFANMTLEMPTPVGPLKQPRPGISFTRCEVPDPTPAPAVGQHNEQLAALSTQPTTRPAGRGKSLSHALEGLRVLDFSAYFATAYAAKMLSDYGADVIKIEPPFGDLMRPIPDPFEACQRGKRNICLDLKKPGALEVVQDLVRTADVVLHNFRPGKAEQIGLGYEQLRTLVPDLIYGHLPGYGATGPRALMKSFAPLISGFVGLNDEGAGVGNKPVRRVLGNEDFYNGFMGAAATLMALEHRAQTGEGQAFEVSQLHATMFTATGNMLDADNNLVRSPNLNPSQTGWSPLYRLYETGDGWIMLACVGDACFDRLREVLELGDIAADDGQLTALLEQRFAARSAAEAFTLLDASAIPVEIARTDVYMDELLWDEWAEQSGRVFEQYHPTIGLIREIGLGVHLSDTPGLKRGPAALLGQHSRDVLLELGYDHDRVETLLNTVCKGR